MQTILVFVPFSRYIFRQMLAGVHRFYGNVAKVQVVEGCNSTARFRYLLKFWKPTGLIIEASEGTGIFTRRNIGDVPVVYLDKARRLWTTASSTSSRTMPQAPCRRHASS